MDRYTERRVREQRRKLFEAFARSELAVCGLLERTACGLPGGTPAAISGRLESLKRASEALPREDRRLLALYCDSAKKAAEYITDELHMSRATYYRRVNGVLEKLGELLADVTAEAS